MNNEEIFKKLLREKLQSKEFSFDEKNWNSMRDMIDESRDKKGRRAILLALCLICITGTLFLYLFMDLPGKENASRALAEKSEPLVPQESSQPAAVVNEKRASSPASSQTLKTPASQKIDDPAEQLLTKETASNRVTKPAPQDGIRTERKTSEDPAKPIAEILPANTAATSEPVLPVVKNEVTPEPEMVVANEPTGPANAELKKEEPVTVEKNVAIAEEAVNTAVEIKPDTTKTLSLAVAPALKADSAAIKPQTMDLGRLLEPPMPKHLVAIEAGANALTGWKTSDKKDANGINLIAGINYMYKLNRQIALSTGVYYTSVNNLSAYSHTSSVTRYGFGESNDLTVITPEKIHYLQMPFKVNLMLNPKNMFGAGYTLGYLLTVDSRVEKYSKGVNTSTTNEVSKTKGYTQGFNTFDSQISVFYRHMIYHNLFVNAEAMLGLADAKKNAFFKSASFERNMGLKITIAYTIFQK